MSKKLVKITISILIFSILFGLVLALLGFFLFKTKRVQADEVTAWVLITVCGNDAIETGEECDGTELGGETCVSRGFNSGTLSCTSLCTFNTNNCASGGGGGGGGIYPPPPPLETKVILQGKAHPNAQLTILKDGQVILADNASSGADFKVEITDITSGIYTFGIWSEDGYGLRSVTANYTIFVQDKAITTISGIFIPPTIAIEKNNYELGEEVRVYGQTAPLSKLEIFVSSDDPTIFISDASDIGEWEYKIATMDIGEGAHYTKARSSAPDGLISIFSQTLNFNVNRDGVPGICAGADLNADGRVDLIDFSILLFWWGTDESCPDMNKDDVVDLIDFSIMLFYWTG